MRTYLFFTPELDENRKKRPLDGWDRTVVYKLTWWIQFVLEKLPVAKLVEISRTFLWNRQFPTELAIVFILSQKNPVHILTTKGEERGGASGAAAPGSTVP